MPPVCSIDWTCSTLGAGDRGLDWVKAWSKKMNSADLTLSVVVVVLSYVLWKTFLCRCNVGNCVWQRTSRQKIPHILSVFSYHSVTASPQPGQRASAPWFRIVTEPVICVFARGEDFVLMFVESRDVKIQPLGSNTNTWCQARRPPELVKHGMASPFMTLYVFIADGFFNFPPETDTAQKVHKKSIFNDVSPATHNAVHLPYFRLKTGLHNGSTPEQILCMPSTTLLPPGPFYIPRHKFWPRTALAMLPLVQPFPLYGFARICLNQTLSVRAAVTDITNS